jgi:hypothetical protein
MTSVLSYCIEEVPANHVPANHVPAIHARALVLYETDKKYRSCSYDEYDGMYARCLKALFNSTMDEPIRRAFNEFTDGLMDEPRIRRNFLLDAIRDFEKQNIDRLSTVFSNEAFNYRPYQPCVIC